MYKWVIRPILFLFDPETIHHFTFKFIRFTSVIPGISSIRKKRYLIKDPGLKRSVFGLDFDNPVGIAAGFDKNAVLLNHLDSYGFGFVEIGTVTPQSQNGNPRPRLFRLKRDQGIINRMGFNNKGVDAMVKRLKKKKTRLIVGGNIGKNTSTKNAKSKPDFVENFAKLHPHVDYFVVNVSCPNVGDTAKLQDKGFLVDLLSTLIEINNSKTVQRPILLKIAPDLNNHQLDEIIEIVSESAIDGVVACNTSINRKGLMEPVESLEKIGKGGLSGKPITDRSTRVIKYLADNSNRSFPIIGVGGIHSAKDALEKIEAGADLIQIFTGFIYEGPKLVRQINKAVLEKKDG
jgi:dihydroorotate dehydrogenase